MLITYFFASSIKSVTELKNLGCCLEKTLALRQQGLSLLLCLPLTVFMPVFSVFPWHVPRFL